MLDHGRHICYARNYSFHSQWFGLELLSDLHAGQINSRQSGPGPAELVVCLNGITKRSKRWRTITSYLWILSFV